MQENFKPKTTLEHMSQAKAVLKRHGVEYQQKSSHHLKVRNFNYWPRKGTIMLDAENTRRTEKGITAFIKILRRAGLTETPATVAADNPREFIIDVPTEELGFETT